MGGNKRNREARELPGQRRWALPTVSSPPAIWSCSKAINDGEGEKFPEIAENRFIR